MIKEPPAPQQQQLPFDHSLDQRPTYPEPAQTQAATFATAVPIEIARARYEPAISTESTKNLQEALDRGVNHATPFEATQDDAHEVKKDRDKLRQDPLGPQQQPSTEHSRTQTPTHTAPAPTKAAELEIEGPELDFGLIL